MEPYFVSFHHFLKVEKLGQGHVAFPWFQRFSCWDVLVESPSSLLHLLVSKACRSFPGLVIGLSLSKGHRPSMTFGSLIFEPMWMDFS